VAFFVSTNPDISGGSASSQPVTISGNNIYGNTNAGIAVRDPINGRVTMTGNSIYQNSRSGIGIRNSCTLDIIANAIYDQIRGGIHTGTDIANPGGFDGTAGSAVLTIRKNKVYGNGQSLYGGGIDVRHADGTICNNLVYENHRGGIRFGDWINEIINNTVSDNGNATEERGGGIIYDDISASHAVNDPPEGIPPAPLLIRNNISTHNEKAGIRACFGMTAASEERDYNLVFSNCQWNDVQGRWNTPDCGWPEATDMSCINQQYGGCGSDWDHWPLSIYPHDITMDPLFVDAPNDNYRIQPISPARNAGDDGADMGAYGGAYPIDW
jgi:parallel beta-helix repeat protein